MSTPVDTKPLTDIRKRRRGVAWRNTQLAIGICTGIHQVLRHATPRCGIRTRIGWGMVLRPATASWPSTPVPTLTKCCAMQHQAAGSGSHRPRNGVAARNTQLAIETFTCVHRVLRHATPHFVTPFQHSPRDSVAARNTSTCNKSPSIGSRIYCCLPDHLFAAWAHHLFDGTLNHG